MVTVHLSRLAHRRCVHIPGLPTVDLVPFCCFIFITGNNTILQCSQRSDRYRVWVIVSTTRPHIPIKYTVLFTYPSKVGKTSRKVKTRMLVINHKHIPTRHPFCSFSFASTFMSIKSVSSTPKWALMCL